MTLSSDETRPSTRPVPRLLMFGIVGGSGVVVNAGLLFLLTDVGHVDYRISGIMAIECAILSNFILNHAWTWGDRPAKSGTEKVKRLAKFNLSSGLVALIVNWGLLVLLTEYVHLYYQVSNLIGIVFGAGANFLISHHWTFRVKTNRAFAPPL